MKIDKFPLAVHFIWHPLENELPLKIMDEVQNVLFKKNTSDFSGCNEIPFFFYSSKEKKICLVTLSCSGLKRILHSFFLVPI